MFSFFSKFIVNRRRRKLKKYTLMLQIAIQNARGNVFMSQYFFKVSFLFAALRNYELNSIGLVPGNKYWFLTWHDLYLVSHDSSFLWRISYLWLISKKLKKFLIWTSEVTIKLKYLVEIRNLPALRQRVYKLDKIVKADRYVCISAHVADWYFHFAHPSSVLSSYSSMLAHGLIEGFNMIAIFWQTFHS